MKKLLLLPVLLTACSGTKTLIGPDGTEHRLLSCGAIENCYETARRSCGGNYEIVNTTQETTSSPNGILSVQNLLVKCQSSHASAPVAADGVTAN